MLKSPPGTFYRVVGGRGSRGSGVIQHISLIAINCLIAMASVTLWPWALYYTW